MQIDRGIRHTKTENRPLSFGVIVIGDEINNVDDVKHEYGHYLQLQEIGAADYLTYVAIPSFIGFCSDIQYEEYYSLPWEYGADLLGGVERDEGTYQYNVYSSQIYIIYWDLVTK